MATGEECRDDFAKIEVMNMRFADIFTRLNVNEKFIVCGHVEAEKLEFV